MEAEATPWAATSFSVSWEVEAVLGAHALATLEVSRALERTGAGWPSVRSVKISGNPVHQSLSSSCLEIFKHN